jgi:predicted dithiol-disulfide oxidoreductase (DUF899 family)
MGWSFPWASSFGGDFNFDFSASFREGQQRGGAAIRASDRLCLAAAPTFAVMALLTGLHRGDMPDKLCSSMQDASPLTAMFPMYLLMSAFHFRPWLKLISRWWRGHDV